MVAVPIVQVRQQEQQWKCQRPDKNPGNPRPVFEAASSTLRNSTGKINRADRSDGQQYGENVTVESHVGVHCAIQCCPALGIAWSWARAITPSRANKFKPRRNRACSVVSRFEISACFFCKV